MKKSAKVIFLISIIITVLLTIFCIAILFFKNDIMYLLGNSNYIPTGVSTRKNTYVIDIPDVNLLDKYQEDGKDMLVIFMASWCHFCQEESEDLNTFINDNKDKKIIVVSHDETKDAMEAFLQEHGYNWFVIFDPDKLIRTNLDPDGSGIPAAYLLNSEGKILNEHIGKLDYEGFINLYKY